MIRNYVVFRDYETGSKNKMRTQPVQLAAVAIDLRKLEVVEDSVFESKMRPIFDDEEAIAKGLDPIQDEALDVNGLTREELEQAPSTKIVWESYLSYLQQYNWKGDTNKWNAPIVGGYNNTNFDDYIDLRMCEMYGPKLDEYGGWSIYHPFYNFDVHSDVQKVMHNMNLGNGGFHSTSMDTIRNFMGYSTENAHDAKVDVIQGADLLIRFLRLYRGVVDGSLGKKIKFKDCVKGAL